MKGLTTILLGTGGAGLVLLAFLALQGQQDVKRDVDVDKAKLEVKEAEFDRTYDERWAAMSKENGGHVSPDQAKKDAGRTAQSEQRIVDAKADLAALKQKQAATNAATEQDLADMKSAINEFEKTGAKK